MKSGRIRIPGHAKTRSLRAFSKFESQMLDLEKAYQGQYMICQHPDTKGAHDDFCDSFALMIWGAKETALPEVEEEENFLFSDARAR
jgi:hypothetical protein